ncbi:sensor histidine kinase [Umezawaea tangerina]|uniref:histidine kinase n=1 Tax=Umezawaea tangerina TaxID=84725 RepID=A0A2T0TK80_9PSEU|nr:histidine kinase [Umezawaea tangerina]PRY46122.1 signal transduction histidine kinase [Umezawaea tangerina]
MSTVKRFRATTRRHPTAVDAVGAAFLYFVAAAPHGPGSVPVFRSPAVLALLGLGFAALVVRRRWPLATLAVATAVVVPAVAVGAQIEPFLIPVVVATYTVAVRTDRWTALRSAVPTALFLVLVVVLLTPTPGFTLESFARFAWIGMAAAIGDAVRSRRANIAAIEERAVRAERTREEEARRRVAEERLHIARELHDVVAHHIAVINVQAGVAGHLITSQPEAAAEALAHVRRSSRAVLDELGGLLGVLRRPEESNTPTEPAPGVAQLESLVGSFRASGLDLRSTLSGEVRDLPATVDLVAYRVVQEALTNAHRYGTGSARLSVSYTESEIILEITNAVGEAREGGTGLGLVGMGERAGAVGGTIQAGPDGGDRFRVLATLPLHLGKKP